MYKILIVEDDKSLCTIIGDTLRRYGYDVRNVTDFRAVEECFDRFAPDITLLDINLPYYDGFYFCRIFRKKSKAPVLIISARDDETHQIMGMEMGADDYITKPFSIDVLIAKVNSIIRRCYGEYSAGSFKGCEAGGLALDDGSFKVSYQGNVCELSKNEFKLLKKLLENPDSIVTREELLEELWDDSAFVDDNTLTVNVTRVKSRLLSMGIADAIKTKRGAGYMFNISVLEGSEHEKNTD